MTAANSAMAVVAAPDPVIIHVIGVTAVWIIFLSSIRFTAVGAAGLRPVAHCAWHLLRCAGPDRPACRRRLVASLDRQYGELLIAITTPWSVVLLFAGMMLIGVGLSCGSVGDVAQLVARHPNRWTGFDRGMDMVGAVGMCGGMAAVHAAVTKHRSLSLVISLGFAITGAGIGIVTAIAP